MTEDILQYCWSNRLFDDLTVRGQQVEVESVGVQNGSDGPDFTMARIRLGSILWVGSVELHLRASDWYAHGHDSDPRYTDLILHIVLEDDREVYDQRGKRVPCGVLRLSKESVDRMTKLQVSGRSLRCTPEITEISIDEIRSCFRPLIHERMHNRVERMAAGPVDEGGVNAFLFRSIMRYLGCHRNNDPMEETARSIPYRALKRHASDPTALEAILLGQAGLLHTTAPRDEYEAQLTEEYLFYRSAFDLTPIGEGKFRKLRLRPAAYPARMLSIAAQIFHHEDELMGAVTTRDWERLDHLLRVKPSPYWQSHLDFGQPSARKIGAIGDSLIRILMINAIIPTVYYYAEWSGSHAGKEAALDRLRELPPERNSYIDLFSRYGITATNALDTQCMLELYTNHCIPYHCLSCPMAIRLFELLRTLPQSGQST